MIGDDCFIGPNAVFCNDIWPEYSKDGYDVGFYEENGPGIFVGNGAGIGAGAVILPGVCIGHRAIVAAGAVVNRNVPDGMCWRANGYIDPAPADRRNKRMRLAKPDERTCNPANG